MSAALEMFISNEKKELQERRKKASESQARVDLIIERVVLEEEELKSRIQRELEERERKIVEVERDIIKIHECYVLLDDMIEQQGETITTIESSIENASQQIEQTVQILEEAKEQTNWFGIFGKIYKIAKWF